jgi:hypothetical protein
MGRPSLPRSFVRIKQLFVAVAAVTLILGACNSNTTSSESPGGTPNAPASSGAPATATSGVTSAPATSAATSGAPSSATGSPSSSTAPSAAPSGSASSSAGACTPTAPTALSSTWTTLTAHDGDYTFKFPPTWDKLYGAFVFTTASLIDADTFAETGLSATNETRADLVRAPGNGIPNGSVLIIPGVTSDLKTIFDRQVKRFGAIQDVSIKNNNLSGCIGGEPAMGVSFTFNKGQTFQESWYVVKAGRVYDFQWLAPADQPQEDLLKEMQATWTWSGNIPTVTPAPRPSGSVAPSVAPTASASQTSFVVGGMATDIDTTAKAADPKTFVSTIPTTSKAFYAVFALKPGLAGQINGALVQSGKVLVTLSLQYGAKNTWGDFKINATNGIAAGDYVMVITYTGNGDTINLPFSVK